jgi:GLPGLI family protein
MKFLFVILFSTLAGQSSIPLEVQKSSALSGRVVYRYVLNTDKSEASLEKISREQPETYAAYGEGMRSMQRHMQNLQFSLDFTQGQSHWQLEEVAVPDDMEEKMYYQTAVIIATEAKSEYFTDLTKGERMFRANLNGGFVNVLKNSNKYTWTITGEEKCVGGRTLYEATTQEEQTDNKGDEMIKKISAWYTPDIPVPFGPSGYDGLPGLILEVKFGDEQNAGFEAAIIEFDSNAKAKILKKPKALGEMTEAEYDQYYLDSYKRGSGRN